MADKARKPYHKPEVTKVKLVPEEAVLATCKTTGTVIGPPSFANCFVTGLGFCSSNVS